nr:hypothetical protein [Tanacetum cinerariifolium]
MSGRRNIHSTNTSTNNEDQPNDLEGMVARQLNAVLPNHVDQFDEALNVNQGNLGGNLTNNNQWCTHKTFMSRKPKEFQCKEGVVGLLSWIKSMESYFISSSVLIIAKWNTRLFYSKLVPHMVTPEDKRIDSYIWGLAPEIRG